MYDIYIRVSRLGDRTEDEATEVYEAQCRDWANRNGISIDEVEEDTDVSGSACRSLPVDNVSRRPDPGAALRIGVCRAGHDYGAGWFSPLPGRACPSP